MSDRRLTPDLVLAAYAAGIFPMAEARDDPEVFWVDPKRRGILPLDRFHLSRSLARKMRKSDAIPTLDTDFAAVIDGCAERPETWINDTIRRLMLALYRAGHAHAFGLWHGGALVGGMYGVSLGGAFFGESMFSRETDASKIVLAVAVDHLHRTGFTLFDTQFLTPHLASLGAVEISRERYREKLNAALSVDANIRSDRLETDLQRVVQRMTQTS